MILAHLRVEELTCGVPVTCSWMMCEMFGRPVLHLASMCCYGQRSRIPILAFRMKLPVCWLKATRVASVDTSGRICIFDAGYLADGSSAGEHDVGQRYRVRTSGPSSLQTQSFELLLLDA